ncbi:unnamed protein product [Danaus chrysippus]|uniref:(African queen) hypothetical protein n=1 Tax=Danaus chrysippus TaxID=151541 RepID=A0A8J2VZA3_9NEOP|nr:unnamed protein product [Danaus chrysippus]
MQNVWTTNDSLYHDNTSALNDNFQNDNVTLPPDPIEDKAIQAAFCTAYTIIFVVGIFGNALVCYAVIRNRAMQTVTNLFITNLALSDILLCVFAVPFTPLYTFLGRWVFGGLLCHIMPYAQVALRSNKESIWSCYYYYAIFVLPFIVMAFCYTCVSIKLNDRLKTRPGSKNSKKEDAERERKRRTNRMLIAMVAIFGLSWLPLNLINISSDFYSLAEDWRYYMVLFFIAHFIAMSSTCYNPFLYAWLNENFRKEFKQILPCLGAIVGKKSKRNYNQSERTGMFRSEKTCNGNETIQESLLTSTVTKPSVRYKIEFNEKLKPYEDDGENISPDEKPEEKPSPTEDYVKMYMFVDKSIVTSDKEPIVSAL